MTSAGDITVFGMVMGIHMIEDISTGVPHGMVVTIPAEKALRSRDLWRAISQKQIFRLHTGSMQAPMIVPSSMADPVPKLIEDNQKLQAALTAQQEQHAAVMAQLKLQAEAIQALTQAVANAPRVVVTGQPGATPVGSQIDGSAPSFIPATIKPDSAEVRIEARREEAEGTDINGNRDKLRRLRQ